MKNHSTIHHTHTPPLHKKTGEKNTKLKKNNETLLAEGKKI